MSRISKFFAQYTRDSDELPVLKPFDMENLAVQNLWFLHRTIQWKVVALSRQHRSEVSVNKTFRFTTDSSLYYFLYVGVSTTVSQKAFKFQKTKFIVSALQIWTLAPGMEDHCPVLRVLCPRYCYSVVIFSAHRYDPKRHTCQMGIT